MKSAHRLQVFGRDLQVRSSAPEEAVREIETFVNHRLSEVADKLPNADQQLVTLLTLLNVSESYLTLEKSASAAENVPAGEIERLLKKLDMALE